MSRSSLRRVFVLLLLALALVWPMAMPVADAAHAGMTSAASEAPADGCRDCDHGAARGTCPAVFCAVPPAVLPAQSPAPADAAGRPVRFALADECGHGRVPGVRTPPPKASPLT
jgi:hypothetical protein